MKSLYELKYLK